MKNSDNIDGMNLICEQGDMGLWLNPLSEDDKKVLREQEEKKQTSSKNH